MDIQLFATDEELKEFPEDKTDPDTASSPNSIYLLIFDLPRSHTDLLNLHLVYLSAKLNVDTGLKEATDTNPI